MSKNTLEPINMKFLIGLFLFLADLCFGQNDSTWIELEIRTDVDFKKLDSSILYDEIKVFEEKKLFAELSTLQKYHFERFTYVGNLRKTFPVFKRKIKELKSIQLIGINISDIPGFTSVEELQSLVIESDKFIVGSELSNFHSLVSLGLYTNPQNGMKRIICELKNLKDLGFSTKRKITLDSLDCLFSLPNLETISLNIDSKSIYRLKYFDSLKKVYFYNKITYKDVVENLPTLKKFDRVSIPVKEINKNELREIKELIKVW